MCLGLLILYVMIIIIGVSFHATGLTNVNIIKRLTLITASILIAAISVVAFVSAHAPHTSTSRSVRSYAELATASKQWLAMVHNNVVVRWVLGVDVRWYSGDISVFSRGSRVPQDHSVHVPRWDQQDRQS